MFQRLHRCAIALACVVLALPAVPAVAQQQQPAPQQPAPPQSAQQPYAPPAGSGLPEIPAVPAVPTIGTGQSMTMVDAVATALQKNFSIQQGALQVFLDRANLAQAEAGLWPTVDFKGTYTQQSPTQVFVTFPPITLPPAVGGGTVAIPQVPVLVTPGSLYSFSLGVSYPFYTGNAVQDAIEIARQKLISDQAAFAANAATVVLQTRQAYYNVLAAEGQVAAAQRAVAASEENVRVTQAQVTVGTAPQFNLLQAQVQLASSQLALTQQKAAAVTAQYTLATVLNVPLSTIVTPATPLTLPQPPQDLNALIQTALRQRPELAEARANLAGATAAIDAARAGLRPTLALSGGPTVQTQSPLTNTPVSWQGVLSLTLAVFDGGLTKAKVEAAQVQLRQAQVSEQQTEQAIDSQVRQAYLNLQQAAEQLRAAEAGLVSAREALRIANVRFQAGVGTQLEVVTAIQNLANADSSVVTAQYNYNVALAQIDQAIGVQAAVSPPQ